MPNSWDIFPSFGKCEVSPTSPFGQKMAEIWGKMNLARPVQSVWHAAEGGSETKKSRDGKQCTRATTAFARRWRRWSAPWS
jgi:hypothetical protein